MYWFVDSASVLLVTIEKATTSPLPLNLYLYADSLKNLLKTPHNQFVKNSGVSIGGNSCSCTGAQTPSGAHEGRKKMSRIATGPCFCE